jgi:DNA-binding transcriptional regulator YiaG
MKKAEIKTVQEKLDLTNYEFSVVCNVSIKTIEKWRSGTRNPSGPAVSLLKIFGIIAKKGAVTKVDVLKTVGYGGDNSNERRGL